MKNLRLKAPLSAQIEVTEVCNLGCTHCFNEERFKQDETLEHTKLQVVKKEKVSSEQFVKLTKELADHNLFSITLTGGEVFTARERIYPSLEVLKRSNIEVKINSNLTLVTKEDAKKLKDLEVVEVMTSLISYDARKHDEIVGKEGAHVKTIKGIELMKNAGIYVRVNMVVSKKNKDHIIKTGKFVSSLGIESFSTAQAIPSHSGGKTHLDHALDSKEVLSYLKDVDEVRKETGLHISLTNPLPYCLVWESHPNLRYLVESAGCNAGRYTMYLNPRGEVKSCSMISQTYGNIITEGLDKVWERMTPWVNNKYIPNFCEPCDLVEICKGACRAEAERTVGNLAAKSSYAFKPIKLDQDVKEEMKFSEGERIKVASKLRIRKETKDLYSVYVQRGKYLFVAENTMRIISEINLSGGLVLSNEYIRDNTFRKVISTAIQSGIMIKTKRDDELKKY